MYLLILEREDRGRERETSVAASCTPPVIEPETQACFLTGNQTGDLLVHDSMLNHLSHISQG